MGMKHDLPYRIQAYIETLTVTQGALAGKPFTVLPWQSQFLKGAFNPSVSEASCSIARGNGKTTLLAAIGCAFLEDSDIVEPASEILITASSVAQGQILYDHILRFLGDSRLRNGYSVRNNSNLLQITNKSNKVKLRVGPAKAAALHGIAPVLMIMDEVAQWQVGQIDRVMAALRTSMGKIPGSRLIGIGTRADSPSHPFELFIKLCEYSQVHSASKAELKNKPFDLRTIVKANPSLRADTRHLFPDLMQAIQKEGKAAKNSPELFAAYSALRLNGGVPDSIDNVLLTLDTWQRIQRKSKRQGRAVWGIDLGGSAAASAITAYYPDSGRLESLSAFSNVPDLHQRGIRDGVGRLYITAKENGELFTTGNRAVDYTELLKLALDRFGKPKVISCDRWRISELKDAMDNIGLYCPIDERGQGYKDGAQDVRLFRRSIAEGKVKVEPGQIFLTQAIAEARTISDPAGNAKLAKSKEGKRRRARDDAAAAAILAVASAQRHAKASSGIKYHGKV